MFLFISLFQHEHTYLCNEQVPLDNDRCPKDKSLANAYWKRYYPQVAKKWVEMGSGKDSKFVSHLGVTLRTIFLFVFNQKKKFRRCH